MSVAGPIVVLFVVFLYSGFRSPLSVLLCFITMFVIIYVSLTSMRTEHVCNLSCIRICVRFYASSRVGFLLKVPKRFLCCNSSLFVRRWLVCSTDRSKAVVPVLLFVALWFILVLFVRWFVLV